MYTVTVTSQAKMRTEMKIAGLCGTDDFTDDEYDRAVEMAMMFTSCNDDGEDSTRIQLVDKEGTIFATREIAGY